MNMLQTKKESDEMEDSFDEADAALVLTTISCSPPTGYGLLKAESGNLLSTSLPTNIGSNPLRSIKPEFKTKVYQCLWKQPKCSFTTASQQEIGQHVRNVHLNTGRLLRDRRSNCESVPSDAMHVDMDANNLYEEDFYYTEVEPDAMESVVHSFRHLQTASPPDVLVTSTPPADSQDGIAKAAYSLLLQQHSPDSAYGSVPVGQLTPDHDYQKKPGNTQTASPNIPMPGMQNQDMTAGSLFSQSLPSRPLSFLSMSPLGTNVDAPIPEINSNRVVPETYQNSLGAAFLSVLQRFSQNPGEPTPNPVDLSTSLPSSWLFPTSATKHMLPSGSSSGISIPSQPSHVFPSNSGGGGVPFHVIAAAAASASSDSNINLTCLSSSPGSTTSGGTNSPPPPSLVGSLPSTSVLKHRRVRSDVKKCRKVYGVEKRDMWCTQCRWKKACTRFME